MRRVEEEGKRISKFRSPSCAQMRDRIEHCGAVYTCTASYRAGDSGEMRDVRGKRERWSKE